MYEITSSLSNLKTRDFSFKFRVDEEMKSLTIEIRQMSWRKFRVRKKSNETPIKDGVFQKLYSLLFLILELESHSGLIIVYF